MLNAVTRLIGIVVLMLAAAMARAEGEGEEMLSLMARPNGREIAGPQIHLVWEKCDRTLLCIGPSDRKIRANDAVGSCLEANPGKLYRARRDSMLAGAAQRVSLQNRVTVFCAQ